MTDDLDMLMVTQSPTPDRPLLGLTVLVVEDSRFASEAMRLLCLRSGARIRRADSLASARKHLRVYRPSVVIVDLGLPDGSGADLIAELTATRPRVDVVLGMSGDSGADALSSAAGADGFIEKPISSLGAFQELILSCLPETTRPEGVHGVSNDEIHPDAIALQDDFVHIADLLTTEKSDERLDYIAQFLSGVARTSGDVEMEIAAHSLAVNRQYNQPYGSDVARIAGLVQARIEPRKVV
ncbi:response regulator [Celeribacter neptunius]|uniref:Response regulator receiver domain-containing protein n=1 Tax=Celeribacter neptunius TaxID=588602 RepID=A0A1I3W712_9RHOB|nr:response regulator [Celeribacter neptunius]SFK02983.1 Response regulator receiver domain-containing protein [Celeribacter neptunius]